MEVEPKKSPLEEQRERLTIQLLKKEVKGDVVKSAIIPVGSLIVALLGVLSGFITQYYSSQTTIQGTVVNLQHKGYANILTTLDSAFYAKQENRLQALHVDKFRQAYYEVELFISREMREQIFNEVEQLVSMLIDQKVMAEEDIAQFANARNKFREHLQDSLW